MLSIGNITVSTHSPTKENRDTAEKELQSFIHELLSTCLCTSRCISLPLCPPHRKSLVDMSPCEHSVHLAEGSSLYIDFVDRGSRTLHIYSPDVETPNVNPILFRCEDVGVQLSVEQDKVAVRGLHPGLATVVVSRSFDGPPLHIFAVQVFNVSDSVVAEVNEVCGLLNDAYMHSVPLYLGASYSYSNDATLTAPHLVARDWLELALQCRVIDALPDDSNFIANQPTESTDKPKTKRKPIAERASAKPAGPTAQELALAALEEDMRELNRDEAARDISKSKHSKKLSSNPWK